MSLPSISVINFTTQLTDQVVQEAVRAMNRQIREDFIPVWGNGRALELHAAAFDLADAATLTEESVRGDSVIYLVDEASLPGALGYHDLNTADIPVGFVFVLNQGDWTITLSHEVLELIIDPTVNIFVPGPDPRDANNTVLHTYEVCDAVERTSYLIDNIPVSNFVTPSYFTIGEAAGTRNDFLGVGVDSFGVTQNSHIAFFDLATSDFVTIVGSAAPKLDIQTKRAAMFDREKPDRPTDDALATVLAEYRQDLPKDECTGLPYMEAITRTARYKGSALAGSLQVTK